MKFARYLQDTQAPEWKRAYIDYRALKKQITAIRREARGEDCDEPHCVSPQLPPVWPTEGATYFSRPSSIVSPDASRFKRDSKLPGKHVSHQLPPQLVRDILDSPEHGADHATHHLSRQSFVHPHKVRPTSMQTLSTAFWMTSTVQSHRTSVQSSMRDNPFLVLPLDKLIPQLSPEEAKFFAMLDVELEKIVSFYLDREEEMQIRWMTLREQLNELGDHMKHVQEFHSKGYGSWYFPVLQRFTGGSTSLSTKNKPLKALDPEAAGGKMHFVDSLSQEIKLKGSIGKQIFQSRDPEDYPQAKRKLKKAVLEHYRGLEVLHNYRVLNITGFRKALKKFEKVTKILAQEQYITERVEQSVLASPMGIHSMMTEIQDMYAALYVRGDKKKAMHILRTGNRAKSHHLSTSLSGFFLGISLLALVSGIYHSCQAETQQAIPGWDALLVVYGVFLIPVLFGLLLGLNLLVWSLSSINYVFIFELDTGTRLDYQQYFETPSIILAGLCSAFWLSFSRIGSEFVLPTTWPLIWLGVVTGLMINPLQLLFKPSRFWLIKKVGKLMLSGVWHVKFTDFWLGDQFCSLIFSLSNLYLVGCIYANRSDGNFDANWEACGYQTRAWPAIFALAALPLSVRLVQSVRRFVDSGRFMHLINGGKYGTGIISYLCFYLWRQENVYGTRFAFYCIFSVVYTVYTVSWDFLMDWSLFQRDARYPLLRKELVYDNYISIYYFAMVLDIILKFNWLYYLPPNGPPYLVRAFICGILDMLRRWLWNFFRLENEHLGNVEQYRVTREVPLPYSFADSYVKGVADD